MYFGSESPFCSGNFSQTISKCDKTVNACVVNPCNSVPEIRELLNSASFTEISNSDECTYISDSNSITCDPAAEVLDTSSSADGLPYDSPTSVTVMPDDDAPDAIQSIKSFKLKYTKNLIISHYNINSIRNKFIEIAPLLTDGCIDIFGITETKLDDSFPNEQFKIPNFKHERQDRSRHGGGIMVYVRDTIPHRINKGVHEGIEYACGQCVNNFLIREIRINT